MRRKNNKSLFIVLLLLVISIGFAYLTSNLSIFGSSMLKGQKWDVHFENVQVSNEGVEIEKPKIIDKTTVEYNITLDKPGDFVEFTVDAKNDGTIDAMIEDIIYPELTDEQKKFIEYSIAYEDGTSLKKRNLLSNGTKETYKVRIEYKKDLNKSDLPKDNAKTVTLSFEVDYVKADMYAFDHEGFDVRLENPSIITNTVGVEELSFNGKNNNVFYDFTIDDESDEFEFTIDAVNHGVVDAKVSNILESPLTKTQEEILDYNVTYKDSDKILEEDDMLQSGQTLTYDIKFSVKDGKIVDEPMAIDGSFGLDFEVADEKAVVKIEKPKPICKRATNLHTEECSQHYVVEDWGDGDLYYSETATCFKNGYVEGSEKGTTIVYGNLGANGILKTGDAFDCDVNGDGNYTERFYYVSDKYIDTIDSETEQRIDNFDSDIAVLIYDKTVINGITPDRSTEICYGSNASTGPITAIKQLPNTTQWSNINLINSSNQLRNVQGGISSVYGPLPLVNYQNKAARLIKYQEIYKACGGTIQSDGRIFDMDSNCEFLSESLGYNDYDNTWTFWLENPNISENNASFYSSAGLVSFSITTSHCYHKGVKPAIEIPKTQLSY